MTSESMLVSNRGAIEQSTPWLDRTEYPFHSHWHTTPDGKLHYLDEGAGPPLLFVHGTPSWSFDWRHQIKALSKTHRCIAVDHLGFGLSDKPSAANVDLRPKAHAKRLQSLIEKLDLRSCGLIVHDFGGPIGLGAALPVIERFNKVAVLNSWMWSNEGQDQIRKTSWLVKSWFGRFLYLQCNFSPRVLVPASFGKTKRCSKTFKKHLLGPFAQRSERDAPWVLGCELYGSNDWYHSLWEQRSKLASLPLTLVWGMRDPAFTVEVLQRWRTAFPHANVCSLPDAGHFAQEEVPEEFLRALQTFL